MWVTFECGYRRLLSDKNLIFRSLDNAPCHHLSARSQYMSKGVNFSENCFLPIAEFYVNLP